MDGDSLVSYYVTADAQERPGRLFVTYQDLLRDLPKEAASVHFFDGSGRHKGAMTITWDDLGPHLIHARGP